MGASFATPNDTATYCRLAHDIITARVEDFPMDAHMLSIFPRRESFEAEIQSAFVDLFHETMVEYWGEALVSEVEAFLPPMQIYFPTNSTRIYWEDRITVAVIKESLRVHGLNFMNQTIKQGLEAHSERKKRLEQYVSNMKGNEWKWEYLKPKIAERKMLRFKKKQRQLEELRSKSIVISFEFDNKVTGILANSWITNLSSGAQRGICRLFDGMFDANVKLFPYVVDGGHRMTLEYDFAVDVNVSNGVRSSFFLQEARQEMSKAQYQQILKGMERFQRKMIANVFILTIAIIAIYNIVVAFRK